MSGLGDKVVVKSAECSLTLAQVIQIWALAKRAERREKGGPE